MKKVILITGASSGIGKDGALKLIKEGHIVYGAARRIEKMQDIVDSGGHFIKLDITNQESIKKAVQKVISEQKRIDVLWNNAGFSVNGAIEDVSYEDAIKQFDVNLFGLAEITKAVIPQMRKQNSGTIVNTSSVGGKVYVPLLASWYHASKFALEGWTDCLRLEMEPFNINVVLIEPGGVKTEFVDGFYDSLIKRSKDGNYEELALLIAKGSKALSYAGKNVSSPSVISDIIVKIVNSKKPKTRYVAGKFSKTMLFLRRILSDRIYDKVITKMIHSVLNNEIKNTKESKL